VSSVTGIELGPNYCVLVRAERHGSRTTVSAARAVTAAEWSDDPHELARVLRKARRSNRLPHRARVVSWGTRGLQPQQDVVPLPELGPLVAAGFEIGAVFSPGQALARIVRAQPTDTDGNAVAALSLNSHGAAIAIVSGQEVLSSRIFEWSLGRPFSGSRTELLDRYLVISQLAPQLQHVIDLVRPVHGANVTSAIACGNLPNLRSLMMLLIQEMDIEVETLDSAELLDPRGAPARLVDFVPALQLASAAASFDETRSASSVDNESRVTFSGIRELPGIGEALPPATDPRRVEDLHQVAPPGQVSQLFAGSTPLLHAAAIAAFTLSVTWSFLQMSGSSPAIPIFPGGVVTVAAITAVPELRTEATMGHVDAGARGSALGQARGDPEPVVPSHIQGRQDQGRPELRSVPLPQVNGIMISGDRRLAIVGGDIVSPGEQVGSLTVARIERAGVVLREPSGREVYVAIRTKKAASGRS